MSKIEWTGATWNPVTGCTKISSGCKNCYAETQAIRLKAMGQKNYRNGFTVTCHPHMLVRPQENKKPTTYFVCSMADLFHKDVPDDFILQVFDVMRSCPHHTFQVLTKRALRLAILSEKLDIPKNVWVGVSVENKKNYQRVDQLRRVQSKNKIIRFLSVEPMLEDMSDIDLTDMDWVICGGESGLRGTLRAIDPVWVRNLRDSCILKRIPFFFKQWGGRNKKKAGGLLDGRKWHEIPVQPKV